MRSRPVIISFIIFLNYERELYDSLADYMMKLAQLEAVVGMELTASPLQVNPGKEYP